MAHYEDIVRDQNNVPVVGALVVVARQDGQSFVMTDDNGFTITNPLTTDGYGLFLFNAPDGFYVLEYTYGGQLRTVLLVEVGDVPTLSDIAEAVEQGVETINDAVTESAVIQAALQGDPFNDPVTQTRYKFGATGVPGEYAICALPHYFVNYDSTAGGTGTTSATTGADRAFPSLANLSSVLGASIVGKTIAVKGGPTIRRDGIDATVRDYVSIIGYDGLVRLDGTDVVPNASFTVDGTYPACYNVTLPITYNAVNSWARMWEGGKPLKRVASKAACDATAGTYFAYLLNGTPTNGSVTVTIHPYGNTNPVSDGKLYEISAREYAVGVDDNCLIHGIYGRRTASHNGAFRTHRNHRTSRLLAEEGTLHNSVFGDGETQDWIGVNCVDNEYNSGAIMLTNFVNASPASMEATNTRCEMIADRSVYGNTIDTGNYNGGGYYCHGTVPGVSWGRINFSSLSMCNISSVAVDGAEVVVTDMLCLSPIGGATDAKGFLGTGVASITGGYFTETARGVSSFASVTVREVLAINELTSYSGGWFYQLGATDRYSYAYNCDFILNGVLNTFQPAIQNKNVAGKATVVAQGCIFDGTKRPYDLYGATFDLTGIDANVMRERDGGAISIAFNGSNYTFGAWQGLGYDTNSVNGNPQWQISKPTITIPNPTLTPGGAGALRQSASVSYAYVQSLLARPRTLAQAIQYLEHDAPRIEVFA